MCCFRRLSCSLNVSPYIHHGNHPLTPCPLFEASYGSLIYKRSLIFHLATNVNIYSLLRRMHTLSVMWKSHTPKANLTHYFLPFRLFTVLSLIKHILIWGWVLLTITWLNKEIAAILDVHKSCTLVQTTHS